MLTIEGSNYDLLKAVYADYELFKLQECYIVLISK